MAAKGFSFAEKMSRSSVMVMNAKANLQEVPYLTDDVATLEQMVGQGRVLESRQDELRSQFQENTKKMKTLAAEAEKLRSRWLRAFSRSTASPTRLCSSSE
jgi:molecular chaperone GrpE (heat shock protein)